MANTDEIRAERYATDTHRAPRRPSQEARALLAQAPDEVREMWVREHVEMVRPADWKSTPEEAKAEVRAYQREVMLRAWESRLPVRFRHAALSDLEPAQDPEGVASRWLADGGLNLLLVGEAGGGKSHTAYAVGNEAARTAGLWAVAIDAATLNESLMPRADGLPAQWKRLTQCDLLIIDDLGRERITEWTLEQIWKVVDTRSREQKRLVVTSNLPYDNRGFGWRPAPPDLPATPNMLDRYGASLIDRLFDDATKIPFKQPSRRRPAAPF